MGDEEGDDNDNNDDDDKDDDGNDSNSDNSEGEGRSQVGDNSGSPNNKVCTPCPFVFHPLSPSALPLPSVMQTPLAHNR
jgi:hypothetical protein